MWKTGSSKVTETHGDRRLVSPTRYTVDVSATPGKHRREERGHRHPYGLRGLVAEPPGTRAWRPRICFVNLHKLEAQVKAAHDAGYAVYVGMDANKGMASI